MWPTTEAPAPETNSQAGGTTSLEPVWAVQQVHGQLSLQRKTPSFKPTNHLKSLNDTVHRKDLVLRRLHRWKTSESAAVVEGSRERSRQEQAGGMGGKIHNRSIGETGQCRSDLRSPDLFCRRGAHSSNVLPTLGINSLQFHYLLSVFSTELLLSKINRLFPWLLLPATFHLDGCNLIYHRRNCILDKHNV